MSLFLALFLLVVTERFGYANEEEEANSFIGVQGNPSDYFFGVLELDEYTFPKVIGGSNLVVIQFYEPDSERCKVAW